MFGGYYSGGMPPHPNFQFPIPSSNRIYPGPTHSGYFSWSSKNHQGQQPNVATTVAKARLNETDIYMSRYELSVKTYLADRYKNSNTNLQISEVLPRQDNRSVLDENIDHSRKLRLAVSPVVKPAPHEGKPVPEQTQMKSIYNRMPAKIGPVGRMSAEAEYVRRGSQMPARIEYVDKSYQIYAEPSALHNASYMNNQQGHQYGIHQTAGNWKVVGHRKPGLGDQGISPNAQHQGIPKEETLVKENLDNFISRSGLPFNMYGGWNGNFSTRKQADHKESVPQELTPPPSPITMAGASTITPNRKSISPSAKKFEWSLSALLAAPFISTSISSNRAWTSSDLLAAPFASPSSSQTSSNCPSGNPSSSNTSQVSKSSNAIRSKGNRHEAIGARSGSGPREAVSSHSIQNHPASTKCELTHWMTQQERPVEKTPSESSLYETADESPPEPVDMHQSVGLGPMNFPPAPAYKLFSLANTDPLHAESPENSPGRADSASPYDLDFNGYCYCYQSGDPSTNPTTPNTSGTDFLNEIGCGDLLLLKDDTAPGVTPIGQLGIHKRKFHSGSGCNDNAKGSIAIPSISPNQTGTNMNTRNPSPRTSEVIGQYLDAFVMPITTTRIRHDIPFTPTPLHSPIPLTIGHETVVERLERLAMDWEEPPVTEATANNCSCGAHTAYQSNSRAPLSPGIVQWLRQDLEKTAREWWPNNYFLEIQKRTIRTAYYN